MGTIDAKQVLLMIYFLPKKEQRTSEIKRPQNCDVSAPHRQAMMATNEYDK